MAIFKCKMCGGDLNIVEGENVYECEYCGSKQTVPTADSEKKMTLFARANRLRFGCEFDKAASVYESIVAEFPEEAEAYWGLILCKYGIEYVDDPATGKKIPTCHRSSFESVMEDSNFEMVMEYSDLGTRPIYRDEAKEIERLRTGIIEVSSKEEPYDIFICYKETDPNGERTIDSVIAQDVYDALTEKGYRVFFSRITLEDKLGQEYEPYIFAALNSAKIMLAFGTDYEYYNAVWVKNEWSRFLQLIAKGEKKTLIPCYKGIDAYDMPKEFAKLQAQDMGKVGATQDLLRGIDKILPKQDNTLNQTIVTKVINQNSSAAEPLLKRAFIFLEDEKWNDADEYCEKALDLDPENAHAYLGKLMAELHIKRENELRNCSEPFDSLDNYLKATKFGGEAFKSRIEGYVCDIKERIRREQERKTKEQKDLYRSVINAINNKKKNNQISMLNKELGQLREQSAKLQEILNNYDSSVCHINELENDLTKKEQEKNAIEERRGKLGLFAGKEKKQLEKEIGTLSQSIYQIRTTIQQKKQEYGLYASKSVIEQELSTAKKNAEDLENNIKKFSETNADLSNDQAQCDCVYFGNYQQKAIEWKIIEKQDKRVLLVTKKAVVQKKYNEDNTAIKWEGCTLRKWLNDEFLKTSFTSNEKEMIDETTVINKDNSLFGTRGGNNTKDKVFLLSIEEANHFFKNDSERVCDASESAGSCMWWLRSPGVDYDCAAFVYDDGSVADYGAGVSEGRALDENGNHIGNIIGVRPAMWINLE